MNLSGSMEKIMLFNISVHTDKQHQIAASRRVLRAGDLQR